jgi:hypothetical protein
LSLAHQVAQSGVRVTVVGDPFGALTQPGFRFVTSFDDAAKDASRAADQLGVIFYGGRDRDDLATIRSTVSRRNPHIVVVIVGDVRPARWSLDVGRERRRR